MKRPLVYILFILCVQSLVSCKINAPVDNNKHLLWRNEFRGNTKVHVDDLELVIPLSQRENSKPLNLPFTPRVWWYNYGQNHFDSLKAERKIAGLQAKIKALKANPNYSLKKESKYQRKIDRHQVTLERGISWFYFNIGEPQKYITQTEIDETAQRIQKYYFDKGFRDAQVTGELKSQWKKNRYNVRYNIQENDIYTIDSVNYVVNDSIIDSLLHASLASQAVKKGDPVDFGLAEREKQRIEQLLKNNGYFAFTNRYIVYGMTNEEEDEELFKERKHGALNIEIQNPENAKHVRYYLQNVVFKTYDPNSSSTAKPDTSIINEVSFIRADKTIPLKPLSARVFTKPGELYSNEAIYKTQRQISLFNQFSFASSQLKRLGGNQLSLEYFAPIQEKYTIGISPGINNIYSDGNSFFGFGIPISLSMRNALHKLEIIELGIRASYEGQPSPIRTSENAIRGSLELGGNLNITFPSLIFLKAKSEKINLKNPRTTLGVGYNYSEPFWGTRTNFKLTAGYSLQLNKNAALYFNFLDAYLINTSYANNPSGQEFYHTLDSLQRIGNNLKVTFDPQFVSSLNLNYVYNNQDPSKLFSNSTFFRFFVESAGTSLNFQKDKESINFVEDLFPMASGPDSVRAYFRFIKVNLDFRKSLNITPKSSYAFRINLGVINPYGGNKAVPYDKSFFVGGSNSVRAWTPRSIGTGSSPTDTTSVGNTIPQPGDILIEGSLEYRLNVLRFAGNIQIATFIDAGNVWKWHQIDIPEKYNKSNFDITRFYKEFAVGTGFGVRWDLSFFLFRFDWGIKVVDPSRPEGSRFVLDEFSLKRYRQYGLNLNFGIGYPF